MYAYVSFRVFLSFLVTVFCVSAYFLPWYAALSHLAQPQYSGKNREQRERKRQFLNQLQPKAHQKRDDWTRTSFCTSFACAPYHHPALNQPFSSSTTHRA
uniref:Uncharacterized protein n=1 Tax=Anopheles braziliensis TaxID=58242 RepID=A0A2M3ZLN1_9DIPT